MRVLLLRRVFSAWWFYALGALFTAVFITPAVRGWPVPDLLAGYLAVGLMGLLVAPFFNLWRYRRSTDYSEIRTIAPVLYASWAGISVTATALLTGDGVPGGTAAATAAVGGVCVATYAAARRARKRAFSRVLRTTDPDHAMELFVICSDALSDYEQMPEDEAAPLMLSLVGTVVTLAARRDQIDDLPVAFEILDDVLNFESDAFELDAAELIVEAMDVKWDRTGDRVGYEDAHQLLMDVAYTAAEHNPTAMARAYAARGSSHLRASSRAAAEGEDNQAEYLRFMAALDFREAFKAAPPHSDERALSALALARAEGANPLEGTLDDAIERCRLALRRLRLIGVEQRASGFLALAELLELRAELDPTMRRLDRARAMRHYARIARKGEYAQEARRRLAQMQDASGSAWQSGFVYPRLLAGEVEARPGGAETIAAKWADWAMRRGDARQAADAWSAWLTAVTADLRRRVLHDKTPRLPKIQARAAVAAYWMVKAGRTREAAVTLDLARAILVTERMQRRRTRLAERLESAGEHELAQRWREAEEALLVEDRATFGTRAGGVDLPYGSAEYLALVDHESLLREIAEVEGFDDVERAPSYSDISAAAREGPIVYFATVEEAGFALIVTGGGSDPIAVELPRLGSAAVHRYAATVRATPGGQRMAQIMRDLLPELWTAALEPVIAHLPQQALVTLVATGPLGELPLHAAATAPDADHVWRDRAPGLVFRYAPNARVLLRSQRVARSFADGPLRVMTAAVPHTPGRRPLDCALAESAHVALAFGHEYAQRPLPATLANVRRHLADSDVWHFACHGTHEPYAPLESRLELADGPLQLSEIFGGDDGRRRLAVLSACQTARIDSAAPDEVVGFPSALLQTGFAGVVSCQGVVEDAAAMLLVLRFFAEFLREREPARALAIAQRWLRTATNADFHRAFPNAYARPSLADHVWDNDRPFAVPTTWVLFNYTGA